MEFWGDKHRGHAVDVNVFGVDFSFFDGHFVQNAHGRPESSPALFEDAADFNEPIEDSASVDSDMLHFAVSEHWVGPWDVHLYVCFWDHLWADLAILLNAWLVSFLFKYVELLGVLIWKGFVLDGDQAVVS